MKMMNVKLKKYSIFDIFSIGSAVPTQYHMN